MKWKKQRYRFYKEKPQTEKEQEELLEVSMEEESEL